MTDHHVHIGQFNELYYDPYEVFEIIDSTSQKTGITHIMYSSTSTCRDDVELTLIEEELAYAQNVKYKKINIEPYLWYIPKYADQGITVESATKSFDYCGIKIHPVAHKWNLNNKNHNQAFHQIFKWASDFSKFILIHCGILECDLPNRFEFFFKEYPLAKVILAHSNPVHETAKIVNKYQNVFCDIACVKENNIKLLQTKVREKNKILFGSDFPTSNYFDVRLFNKYYSLKEQYLQDCSKLNILLKKSKLN